MLLPFGLYKKLRVNKLIHEVANVDIFREGAFFAGMAINYPPEILRAGRALLGWKQSQLAQAAGVSRHTLLRVEEGQNVMLDSMVSIVRALEDQGVEFTVATSNHGAGVRWRNPKGPTGKGQE